MAAPQSRETKGPMAALRGQGAGKLSRYPTAPGGPNPGRGTGQAGSTVKHCQTHAESIPPAPGGQNPGRGTGKLAAKSRKVKHCLLMVQRN